MKSSTLFASILIFSISALASDFGVVVGARNDSATSNTTTTQVNSNTNYMAGVVGAIDAYSQIQIRTGFLYTSRAYGYVPATGATGTATFTSLDVPVGLLWKLSDYGGPFVGANVAMNVSSSCPGTCTNVAGFPAGVQIGAQFKFAPMFGGAIYYESMAAVVNGIDNPKAAVAQLIMTF